jgi:hypothetical protein
MRMIALFSLLTLCAMSTMAGTENLLEPADRSGHSTKAGSMLSDELTFLRRLHLDATGVPPTREQVQSFRQDTSQQKYRQAIEQVLSSEQFTDRWTTFFEDLFQNHNMFLFGENAPMRNGLHRLIRDHIARNAGWDELATSILTSTGRVDAQQSSAFIWTKDVIEEGLRWDVVDDQAAWMSQALLGIRAECISCHDGGRIYQVNKGLSKMSREDFWGLAAFLSSSYLYYPYNSQDEEYMPYIVDSDAPGFVKQGEFAYAYGSEIYLEDPMYGDGEYHAVSTAGQGMRPPRAGGIIAPKYPFTGEAPQAGETRRQALARIMTKDRQFARNIVNRVWAHYFGEGFVMPLDSWDLARVDPVTAAANDTTVQVRDRALLEFLTGQFIDSGYDLRALMRNILNSRVYQWEYRNMTSDQATNSDLPWSYWRSDKRIRRVESEAVAMSFYRSLGLQPRFLVGGMNGKLYTNMWGTPGPETPDYSGIYNFETGEVVNYQDYGFSSEEEMWFYVETAESFNREFGRGDYIGGQLRTNESTIQNSLFMMNNYFTNLFLEDPESFPTVAYWSERLEEGEATAETFVQFVFEDLLFRSPTEAERQLMLSQLNNMNPWDAVPNIYWALMNHADFLHR